MKSLVWFVTGASRGFGLEIARTALARGDAVVAAAKDPRAALRALGPHERLLAIGLDSSDARQAEEAGRAALERFGRVDVLVNSAGHGRAGIVREASADDARSILAVNLQGLLSVACAVLPSMRERRSGRNVQIRSVGGLASWPGFGIYCASKAAARAVNEVLDARLLPLGIRVTDDYSAVSALRARARTGRVP